MHLSKEQNEAIMSTLIYENKNLKLVLNSDGTAESLISKATGEELLYTKTKLPMFYAEQERPYNNEIKLIYMNKSTRLYSTEIKQIDEGMLSIKFGLFPFYAHIKVSVYDEYITFTLQELVPDTSLTEPYPVPMDCPPITELTLISLPFPKADRFGPWMNVAHTGTSSAAIMAVSPHPYINAEEFGDIRTLSATARRGILLKGCTAALVVARTDKFLDAVDSLEHDFGLPLGVESRKHPLMNASGLWAHDLCPANVDEYISYVKRAGIRCILLFYTCMFEHGSRGYVRCGDYEYNDSYPGGDSDMRLVLDKIKAAGITPGFHFLHTHIGIESKYVTPHADRRLLLKKSFTLSRPLSKDDTVIYVDQSPIDSPMTYEPCRILRFDGEIISYEGYTAEPPYMFYGCKRGHFGTEITEHKEFTVGGILELSEYGGTSIYLDQNSDLQDEIGEKLARIYDLGFEFIYLDGSEGTNAPFDYHVPNAQYRIYKKLGKAPILCEGAAKAHFGWHMLSGGNAFDYFPAEVFKEKTIEHPFTEAGIMQNDFTRVDFGWWILTDETRVDLWEFGTSKAYSYDCPITADMRLDAMRKHKRIDDILEMIRRWELARKDKLLSDEEKAKLRDVNKEHTLLLNKDGRLELAEYKEARLSNNSKNVHAYVFERNGLSYAVVWDNEGESTVTLPESAVISYTKEVETEKIPYTVLSSWAKLPVSSRAYICTSLTLTELEEVLFSAVIE